MESPHRHLAGPGRLLACLVIACLPGSGEARGSQASPKSSSTPSTTQGIAKGKLAETPIDVLSGRLMVRMPEGAKIQARPFGIMAAPESEEHETRVVFDSDQERLVLMVHEVFAFAGVDFESDVKGWVANWRGKYRIEPFPLPVGGLKAIAIIPENDPDHSRSNDATFVEGIVVRSEDRTLQALDVYVNAAAEKDLKGCRTLAHQILLSVAPGKKKLDLSAGERRLFAYSKDVEISVIVPKNTVATKQVGPDFLVHRLIVLGPLGSDAGSILIYVGGAPDYQPGAQKEVAVIFGQNVAWHSLAQGKGLETLCDLPVPGDNHLKAHIIVQAPSEDQLKVLKQAAESMKLVEPKKSPPK